MDAPTSDLLQLSQQVKAFCIDRNWDQFHGAKDLAIGLVTEASELLELFRFQTDTQVQAILKSADARANIGDELADVLFFLLRFAQRFDFDLNECFQVKMIKNGKKYPVETSRNSNAKYTALAALDPEQNASKE